MKIYLQVKKWENSNEIRFLKKILDRVHLKENNKVNVEENNEKIILSKMKKYLSFDERLKNYHGGRLKNDFEWNEPVGREI